MLGINVPVAFLGGLVSFFAPCVLPLVPAYIGYIAGVKSKVILSSLLYIAGFSVVFMLFGLVAGGVGIFLRRYTFLFQRVGGMVIVLLGLDFAGILRIPFLAKERRLSLPGWAENWGYFRSFLVGVIFAAAWTPCVGAVLGSILSLAAITETALTGAFLLFVYSLGISLPFLAVSLTLSLTSKFVPVFSRFSGVVSVVSGLLLAALGLLLATDTYKYVNSWFFEVAFRLGYQIK